MRGWNKSKSLGGVWGGGSTQGDTEAERLKYLAFRYVSALIFICHAVTSQ